MIDLTKLWDQTYLFSALLPSLSRSDIIFFWLSVVFIAFGLIAQFFALRSPIGSPRKVLCSRLFNMFFWIGLLVLLWFGGRFENIPLISRHIVVLGFLMIGLVWFGFIFRFYFLRYRSAQKRWDQEQIKLKYIK